MKSALKSPILYIIVAALLIRLIYLFVGIPDSGQVAALSIDELYHYNWAAAIADGDILANAPYFRAPLYPFFLAGLLKISGHSVVFIRLIQLFLGLGTIWLTYRIGRVLFSQLVGLIAAVLLALYPISLFFDGQLLLDALFTLLGAASLYCFIETEDKKAHLPLAGLFFGMAAIARPTVLIFLPVAAFILWQRHRGDKKTLLKGFGAFLLTMVLCIAPVTIINYTASGQMMLISYQGGVNFYIGNNAQANGLYSELPGFGADWTLDDVDYEAYRETGEPLRYSEQSRFWMKKGLAYIIDHPAEFMALFAKKLFFFFSGHEISNNRRLDISVFANPILQYLPVRFWLLLALAIAGLCLPGITNYNAGRIAGIIMIYALAISLFFVASRFRLPIIPLMAILSAIGIGRIIEAFMHRAFGPRLFIAVALGITAAVCMTSDIYSGTRNDDRHALFIKGNTAMRAGEYRTAIAYYDSITALPGYFQDSFVNRGLAYLKLGDTKNSIESFHAELRANPQSAEAMNDLAAVYLVNGQTDSARFYASSSLTIKPYDKQAAINLLRTAVADTTGREAIEAQRRQFRRFVEKYPEYLFEEALYFAALGRYSEAIDNQLRVRERLDATHAVISFKTQSFATPNASRERLAVLSDYQLGYLYGLTGQFEASIRFSRQAIAADSLLKEAYINLISGYRSLGRSGEADSVVAIYLRHWPR
ncbi:MAG: glycosyltransferase family 39 protein [Candidatus Zixiibacteriota bacterium]